jgi:cytoskeletal protein CcmA (bactofilin family)
MPLLQHDVASHDLKALLGVGTEFEGKLVFEGTVRIDGKFSGSITRGDMLIIGEGATVSAEIACRSVVVCGQVTGNIRATDSVELRQQARVRGDIDTPSLAIERGARFEGITRMSSRPEAARGSSPIMDQPAHAASRAVLPPLAAVNS